jgi:hypothetical protein
MATTAARNSLGGGTFNKMPSPHRQTTKHPLFAAGGTKAALTNKGDSRAALNWPTPYSLAEDCRITSNIRVFGNEGPPIKADEDS